MKKYKLYIVFIVGLSILVTAIGLATNSLINVGTDTSSLHGPIHCDSPSFNLGKIYHPSPKLLQPRFTIKNTSNETVSLRIANKSCACTNVKLLKTSLGSNEETELCVEWKLQEQTGRSEFAVFVESEPRGFLRLSGSVDICDVLSLDKNEIQLGDIKPGEIKKAQIKIRPWVGEFLSPNVTVTKADTSNIEFDIIEKSRTNDSSVVEVSVTGRAGFGKKAYKLAIKTENTTQPVIEVPVNANHLDLYEAKPSVVMLSNNIDDSKLVKIISNCKLPAVIERVVIDNESVISAIQIENESKTNLVRLQCKKEQKSNEQVYGSVSIFVAGQSNPISVKYICL